MKKIIVYALLLVFVSTAFAQKLRIEDHNLLGCPKNVKGHVTIPSSVRVIGEHAFDSCNGLTSVTIPTSVLWIGRYAFVSCNGLTSVTIPASVDVVGSQAFYDCTGLKSIIVAPQNRSYCSINGVLYSKDKTTLVAYPIAHGSSFTIPSSVTKISFCAFKNCTNLTSVTIPSSVKEIEGFAFSGCTGLKSVTIPASVTKISETTFAGCTGLKEIIVSPQNEHYCSIDGVLYSKDKTTLVTYPIAHGAEFTIPSSVKEIGVVAFKGCTNLKSVDIPSSVKEIGVDAFKNCTSLTSINIPEGVKRIIWFTFEGCTSLATVTIPSSVNQIDKIAFRDCTGLAKFTVAEQNKNYCSINGVLYTKDKSILVVAPRTYEGELDIPEGVTKIDWRTFENCTGLTSVTIPSTVKEIYSDAFKGCTGLKSVTIREGVKMIQYSAFDSCTSLTSITIPASVTKIDGLTFYNCVGLKSITVSPQSEHYCSIDGVLYSKDKTDLVAYPADHGTEFTIPSTVTKIHGYTFDGCARLKSVTIPESVTEIGGRAFKDCTSLTSITIPESVKLVYGCCVFSGCTALKTARVPTELSIRDFDFPKSCQIIRY